VQRVFFHARVATIDRGLTGTSQFAKVKDAGAMHIISRKKLLEADREHRGVGVPLDAWYRTAKSATWRNLNEVRRTYSHADGVPVGERVFTVFDILGNRYRLITEIFMRIRRSS
jgi:mRNA interferase HigB